MERWIGCLAGYLGPYSLWGIDCSPGDARIVRLELRPGGWKPIWWERSDEPGSLARWVLEHKLASRGFRLAIGGLPVFHVAPGEPDAMLPQALPDDCERMTESGRAARWDFFWRTGHVARRLQSPELELADSVHAVSSLLPSLLDGAICPEAWVALRIQRRLAQVWFMKGDRIERFLELDGGDADPALLGVEWRNLVEQIPTELPSWRAAPVAFLEPEGVDLLPELGHARIDPPWKQDVRAVPSAFRMAFAVSLACGDGALEERFDGPLALDSIGRIAAARWLFRGVALALALLVAALASWGVALWHGSKAETLRLDLLRDSAKVAAFEASRLRQEQDSRWKSEYVRSGGGMAARFAALSGCWPDGAWLDEWSGRRENGHIRQELSAWATSGPEAISLCLGELPGNLKIQSTETWSSERWKRDKSTSIGASVIHLGIRSEDP